MSLTDDDLKAMQRLHEFCRPNGLGWELEYAEGESLFYLTVKGAGRGENWHSRKCSTIHWVVTYVIEQAEADMAKWIKERGANG